MWILVFAKNPLVFVLALYWLGMLAAYAQTASLQSAINTSQRSQERMKVHYVGSFLSAKDFGPKHPILDRTLHIVAGPADPSPDNRQLAKAFGCPCEFRP